MGEEFFDKIDLGCNLGINVAGVAARSMTVYTADHNKVKDDGEVSHKVCRKTEHSGYDSGTQDKDIAILHLCKPLVFTEVVGPICLPDPNLNYENKTALVTGWDIKTSSP